MGADILHFLLEPLLDIWKTFTSWVPGIFTALIVMLLGLVLARLLTTFVTRVLAKVDLDRHTSQFGINEIFTRVGFGKSPAFAIGFIVYWSVILVFVTAAANVLNLPVLKDVLRSFMLFIPHMAVAVLVMVCGMLFAKLMHEVVTNACTANNIRGGGHLANLAHTIILIFAALLALEQLGIRMTLIESSLNIILGSIGLAFALAVGLGAKELVAEYLRGVFSKEKKP